MTQRKTPARGLGKTRSMSQPIPETAPDYDRMRIIERPNGFFWQSKEDGREYGPFATLVEAVLDMQGAGAEPLEPGATLAEAEHELGRAEWVDPDTGELAPEERPRLEEH